MSAHAQGAAPRGAHDLNRGAVRLAVLCGLRPEGWRPPRPGDYVLTPEAIQLREDLAGETRLVRMRRAQVEALRLRNEEGLSYGEIAERLGYSDASSASDAARRAARRQEASHAA